MRRSGTGYCSTSRLGLFLFIAIIDAYEDAQVSAEIGSRLVEFFRRGLGHEALAKAISDRERLRFGYLVRRDHTREISTDTSEYTRRKRCQAQLCLGRRKRLETEMLFNAHDTFLEFGSLFVIGIHLVLGTVIDAGDLAIKRIRFRFEMIEPGLDTTQSCFNAIQPGLDTIQSGLNLIEARINVPETIMDPVELSFDHGGQVIERNFFGHSGRSVTYPS